MLAPVCLFFFRRKLLLFARFTGGAVFEGTYPGVRGPHVFHFCPRRPVAGLHLLLLLVRTAPSSSRTANAVPRTPYSKANTVQYGDCRTIRTILPRGATNASHYHTPCTVPHALQRTAERLLAVPNNIDFVERRYEGSAESVQYE